MRLTGSGYTVNRRQCEGRFGSSLVRWSKVPPPVACSFVKSGPILRTAARNFCVAPTRAPNRRSADERGATWGEPEISDVPSKEQRVGRGEGGGALLMWQNADYRIPSGGAAVPLRPRIGRDLYDSRQITSANKISIGRTRGHVAARFLVAFPSNQIKRKSVLAI